MSIMNFAWVAFKCFFRVMARAIKSSLVNQPNHFMLHVVWFTEQMSDELAGHIGSAAPPPIMPPRRTRLRCQPMKVTRLSRHWSLHPWRGGFLPSTTGRLHRPCLPFEWVVCRPVTCRVLHMDARRLISSNLALE